MSAEIKAVPGAARYWSVGPRVYMEETGGTLSVIEEKRGPKATETARKCATSWQKRENAAVTREAKRVARLAVK